MSDKEKWLDGELWNFVRGAAIDLEIPLKSPAEEQLYWHMKQACGVYANVLAVECTAPAPQPAEEIVKGLSLRGIQYCSELADEGGPWESVAEPEPQYFATFLEAYDFQIELAATPQVTRWKSHFTDSDVTGDIHNYVDTGDGKRLWAQDADEIVRRHNEGTSEQASPAPELCLGCGQECDIRKGTLVSVNGWYHESCAPKLFAPATQRSDKDYAIEHAEYLAQAAEAFLRVSNERAKAAEESEDVEDLMNADELLSDHWRALNSAIYEFRKRAKRALPAAPEEKKSRPPLRRQIETQGI
jgi:hypothetical protein